jgi:hypothetical protein
MHRDEPAHVNDECAKAVSDSAFVPALQLARRTLFLLPCPPLLLTDHHTFSYPYF